MKFHEIDCIGRFWMNRVSTIPAWTTADVGRLIYVEDQNAVYYGGSETYADWISMSEHFIDEGTALDPDTLVSMNSREYILKIVNGNFRLYYD